MRRDLSYIGAMWSVPNPIFVLQPDGLLIDANRAGLDMLGHHELKTPIALSAIVPASDSELLRLLELGHNNPSPTLGQLEVSSDAGGQALAFEVWSVTAAEQTLIILELEPRISAPNRVRLLDKQLKSLQLEVEARRVAEAKLREALGARDDFIATAAHELRNPLNVFHLTLQLLYRRCAEIPDGERIRELLDRARAQLRRLNALVERLLDVTRMQGGRLELNVENLDLAGLVREVCARFTQSQPAVPIEVKAPPNLPGLWDRLRMDEVVTNLLSNASKYGQGKPVEVTIAALDEAIELSVRDHGIGFPPEKAPHIFERFQRFSPHGKRDGWGLGLWITKQIVEAHGGSISANAQPGLGACFTLRLPQPAEGEASHS